MNNNLVVKKVNILNSTWRIQQLVTKAENSIKFFQDNTWGYIKAEIVNKTEIKGPNFRNAKRKLLQKYRKQSTVEESKQDFR